MELTEISEYFLIQRKHV